MVFQSLWSALRKEYFVGVIYLPSCVWLFVTRWTVAQQAPLSMGFSRQEYWSGLPFPSPGDLPDRGIKPRPPALASGFFTADKGNTTWFSTTSIQWLSFERPGAPLKVSFYFCKAWPQIQLGASKYQQICQVKIKNGSSKDSKHFAPLISLNSPPSDISFFTWPFCKWYRIMFLISKNLM